MKKSIIRINIELFLKEAELRGYKIEFVWESWLIYYLSNGKKRILFFWVDWWKNSKLWRSIVINKKISYDYFEYEWLSYPKYILYNKDMDKVIQNVGFPCVVKPNDWSLGKWIVVNINTKRHLLKSIEYAKKFWRIILIQKYVEWDNYRVLYINNKVVWVLKRIRHSVFWDWKSTIEQLVNKEINNKNRKKILNKIEYTKELIEFIKVQYWYGMNKVLNKWEIIYINWNWYNSIEDYTDNIHNWIHKLCKKISNKFKLKFFWVDIISNDLSNINEDYYILEINSNPWLKSHLNPLIWKPRNVVKDLMDMYFW